MSTFSDQLEEIKTLVLSPSNSDKSFGYSTLQRLQQQSTDDDSVIQSLIDCSELILSSIVADINVVDSDEEIVVLALKCLGFMVYHPSICAAISKQWINTVLESLTRLITTTKNKAVCNLGVWCISMQQLEASSLALHFDSLLRSVVHSLDNPIGSLSTTFEGIQAVMKLADQLGEKMRDTSSIWVPPIYRRLLSADKREREMCQRCLLKIKGLIVPPQQALSKAIAHDLKLKLLPTMKEILKQGKKVQVLLAWRWYICILGYHSSKSRHLVNELLKVPEQTFSDSDPQVQIATLVAWEGLIDALLSLPSNVSVSDTSEGNKGFIQTAGYSKGLKLIMTPIIGIMETKTDFSVQSSCLNAWYYLLHKLGSFVNEPSILGLVVEPVFRAIFTIKLDDSNLWIWSVCMNLLQDLLLSKSLDNGSHTEVACNLSPRITDSKSPLFGNSTLKTYSVKWLPWDCSHMDFLQRMIQMTFSQAAVATLGSENNSSMVCDRLQTMFRLFLKGIQIDLEKSLTSYETVMKSMNNIFGLVKTLCEAVLGVGGKSTSGFHAIYLLSLEAVIQELDPYILGSPLYKVPLDVEYVSRSETRQKTEVGSFSMSYMDMVPPVTYITVLYYYVVVQVSNKAVNHEFTLHDTSGYLNSVLSSYELLDVLNAITASLYTCGGNSSVSVWISVAHCLRDHLRGAKDLLPLKIQPNTSGSNTLHKFLIFPHVVCLSCKSKGLLPLKEVIDAWTSLYSYVNSTILQGFGRKNWLAEDLSSSLTVFLHQQHYFSEGNSLEHEGVSFCGDVGKCILENLTVEKVTPEAIKFNHTGSSGINTCLEFIARLTSLDGTKLENAPKSVVISRLLPPLINVVSHFQWKEDITSFLKALGDPLVPWISGFVTNSEHISDQISLLWAEIIRSLHRSWPSIEFDSSFLKLQSPLLEKTLNHPMPTISEPTINFWNLAYGDQLHLDFPPCLLPVLDKLSQHGKIKIRNRRLPEKHEVSATLRVCSKRVELLKNGMVPRDPKRKRSELTEHQREVKRAQQGKGRDCSGHGPGIRTYTSLDFSQGNEDSQDSQDVRDPELILHLLKKVE